MTPQPKLKVLIIGAGIAGLASGMMLREFMDVTILESASELKEVGAAVMLGPSAVKILEDYGIHLVQEGGVVNTQRSLWTSSGDQVASNPYEPGETPGTGNDHISIHRVDLHSALLRSATAAGGPGNPCTILLGHRVVQVNTETGTVTVVDGSEFHADVLIGADGIHSQVRSFVVDGHTAQPSGESTYRFMLREEDLRAIDSPILIDGKIPPMMHVVNGQQKRIIVYPCRGGTALNCGALVPDTELHEYASGKWTVKGDVNALLKSFQDFDPTWTGIIKIAHDVGLWQLRDIEPLPNWVKGRVILIGDAAHAMLPHQGAGAMSAIEDAEALSAFLRTASSELHSIDSALKHVYRVRFKRTSWYQARSRATGLSAPISGPEAIEVLELGVYTSATQWELQRPDMILPDNQL